MNLIFSQAHEKRKIKLTPKKKKVVEDWIVILFYARKQVNIHLTKPQR